MSDEDVKIAGQQLAAFSIHNKKPLQEVQNLPLPELDTHVKSELRDGLPIKRETPAARSGSDSSPSLSDQVRYNNLIAKAKRLTSEGQVAEAMQLYKKALKLSYSEKLVKRINKMEAYLKECSEKSSDDDDGNMIDMGSGFFLFKDLYSKLYSHQKVGVLWLWKLFKRKKGGILGDDMGLGKTIQVIAFLSGMFDMDKVRSVLIINPVTVMSNWEKEFSKWAPGINVMLFHGNSKRERERSLRNIHNRGGVLLTSYGLVVTSYEQFSHSDGREFVWDYVILDEGHKIKNPTKTTKAVHAIPAAHRIILTGTPVQNNLRELWALFDFVHQGSLLGTSRTFKMEYENPITKSREKDSTNHAKKLGEEMALSLKKIIEPYFLRRTKDEVQANTERSLQEPGSQETDHAVMPLLTRKNDLVIWLFLSMAQQKIYEDFLSLDSVKELLMTTRSPLVALNVLKKICDHPRLLSIKAIAQLGLDGDEGLEESMTDHPSAMESAVTNIKNVDDSVLINESGKLQVLIELLDNLKGEGHRSLVFSQSRKMLDIIQKIISNRGHKVMRLDGTVKLMCDRDERIRKFQNDDSYSVFLLTTQVGGVGLTLTAADRVIIYDPSWNPAMDAQAVDRVFRIGQNKNIIIYRLITCGSVEEKIYRRQIFKDSITRQTTGASKNPYRYFSKSELRELFILDNPRYSTTQEQLQGMHCDQRRSDVSLDQHIAYLHSLDIFGVSDHDLMFSQEAEPEENMVENDQHSSSDYIQNRVQKAQELLEMESSLPSTMEQRMGLVPRVNSEVRRQFPNRPPAFNPPAQFVLGNHDQADSALVDLVKVERQNDDIIDLTASSRKENEHTHTEFAGSIIMIDVDDEPDAVLSSVKQVKMNSEDISTEAVDEETVGEMLDSSVVRTQTVERDSERSEEPNDVQLPQDIPHAEPMPPQPLDRTDTESTSHLNESLSPEQARDGKDSCVSEHSENTEDLGIKNTVGDNQNLDVQTDIKGQIESVSPDTVNKVFLQSKSPFTPNRGSGAIVEEELLISPDPSLPLIGLKPKRPSTMSCYSKTLFPDKEKTKGKETSLNSDNVTTPHPTGNQLERKIESTVISCETNNHPDEVLHKNHGFAVSKGLTLVEEKLDKEDYRTSDKLEKRGESLSGGESPETCGTAGSSLSSSFSQLKVDNEKSLTRSPGSLLDRTLLDADSDSRSDSASSVPAKGFACSPGSLINRTIVESVFDSPDSSLQQRLSKSCKKSPGSILSRTFIGSVEESPHGGSSTSSSGGTKSRKLWETFVEDSPETVTADRHAGHVAELVENTPDLADTSDLRCPDSDLQEEISSSFEFINNSNANDDGDNDGTPVKKTRKRRSVCRKKVIESSDDESIDAKDDQSRPSSAELVEEDHDDSSHVDVVSRPESAMSVEEAQGEVANTDDGNTDGGFLLQDDEEKEPSINETQNSSQCDESDEDSCIDDDGVQHDDDDDDSDNDDSDDSEDELTGDEDEQTGGLDESQHDEGDENESQHDEGDENESQHDEGDENESQHDEGDENESRHDEGDENADTSSEYTDSEEEDEFDALPEKQQRKFHRLMDKGSNLFKENDLEGALIHILQAVKIYEDPDAQRLAHKIEKKIAKKIAKNRLGN